MISLLGSCRGEFRAEKVEVAMELVRGPGIGVRLGMTIHDHQLSK